MKIKHPTIKDYNLNYESISGPENAVFYRGKVLGKTEINLPQYWTELVDETTISVHITPIGAHQDIIVKRVGQNRVWLQSKSGIPIHCYYLVMGERRDVPKLIPEQPLTDT
jgi:hypothetical protein